LIRYNHLNEEFIYFRSQPASFTEPENVYFLHVVSPSEVNWKNCFTLSNDGMTVYRKGKVEFTPPEKWVNEVALYLKIQKIKFFKRYQHWRGMNVKSSQNHCPFNIY
jgi:hypothetical protein